MASSNQPTSNSSLVLETVDASTIDDWIECNQAAFAPIPEGCKIGFFDIFFPNGMTPEIKAWNKGQHHQNLKAEDVFYFVVRDTSLPDKPAVGAARWQLVAKPKSKQDLEADDKKAAEDRSADQHVPGVLHDRFDVFRKSQEKAKTENMADRAFLYLKSMCVRPEHQRRGVASMLMKWGMDKADEKGVPIYLEASADGEKLYRYHGFEDKGYLDFDATVFEGVQDRHLSIVMQREPRAIKAGT